MFDKVTQRLVQRIDPDGELIAVSRLSDSDNLKPLAVVMKYPAVLPWQKAKYKTTNLTLSNLLQGEPIHPVVVNTELVTYEEKHKGKVSGSLEAGVNAVSVAAQGSGASQLSSSLGTLQKDTVNMSNLIMDSYDRTLNLQHPLLQQRFGKSKSKSKYLITVVMERVFTTSNFKLEYNNQQEGSFNTILKTLSLGTAQMSLKQSGNLQYDTQVTMEIPSHTVVAYSVTELKIWDDGQYDISMLSNRDLLVDITDEKEVDGLLAPAELNALKTELEGVKTHLCVFSHLSHHSRSSLFLKFQEVLVDRELLSVLEDRLDELVCGDSPGVFQSQTSDSSQQFIDTFMELLQPEASSANTLSEQKQPVLTAMHILVSAAMGLTDEGLLLLKHFCSSHLLKELNDLIAFLTDDLQPVLFTRLPAPLHNADLLRGAEQLLSSANVVLKTDSEQLCAEMKPHSGFLPFLLCTLIHGLSSLSDTQNQAC